MSAPTNARGDRLASLKKLLAQMNSVELVQAERAVEAEQLERERQAYEQAKEQIREIAQQYGLTMADLHRAINNELARGRPQGPTKARYQHPDNPYLLWSGRGKKPRWVQEWESEGGTLEQLKRD